LISFFDIPEKFFNYHFRKVNAQKRYRKFTINKSTGKPRTIHAVTKRFKTIQCIALEKLQADKKFQPSSHAHGFTPGKSIVTNATIHRRSKRIIKMDLKDFFHSIHFGRVRGMFMSYPFEFGEKAATTMAQLACLDDKSGILPQGGSLSPYVANMMCRRLDKRLAQVARDHRCHFTRYADDMTFSTNDVSQKNIDDLIKEASSVIEDENFFVNTDKTKILTPGERQVVTGIIVNDGLNVNRRYVRNLRATLRNCEKFGIESQLERKVFRDSRCSRPQKYKNLKIHKEYFLSHLFGKINFYGSVVLSNNQDERNRKTDGNLYKRVQTYENILFRFYELLLKEFKHDNDLQIKIKPVLRSISKHPRLIMKLSILEKVNVLRKEAFWEFNEKVETQNLKEELDLIDSESKLIDFAQQMGEKDPRFFKLPIKSSFIEAKLQLHKLLAHPAISPAKTIKVLHSLKDRGGLRELVHDSSNSNISVKDCYQKLCDYYEKEVYYLPKRLRDEFDDWKDNLYKVLTKYGEAHLIDVINGEFIGDATEKLKINTRFGDHPEYSSILEQEIQGLIDNVGLESDRVKIEVGPPIGFYTHVPSILDSIREVLQSMSKRTHKPNKIYIDLKKTEDDKIELTIYNKSKRGLHDEELDDRSFAKGKLLKVIHLTNGLCEYWIEGRLENGKGKMINMHNGRNVGVSDLKPGFAHRFIFIK